MRYYKEMGHAVAGQQLKKNIFMCAVSMVMGNEREKFSNE